MATLIASQALSDVQPRSVHVGEQAVISIYSLTATLSVGDIIQIAKLPDNARVTNVMCEVVGVLFDGKLNVGTRADHDAFMASETFAASRIIAMEAGLGTLIDISDADSTRYTMLEAKVSDSTSASGTSAGSLRFKVSYILDQSTT